MTIVETKIHLCGEIAPLSMARRLNFASLIGVALFIVTLVYLNAFMKWPEPGSDVLNQSGATPSNQATLNAPIVTQSSKRYIFILQLYVYAACQARKH